MSTQNNGQWGVLCSYCLENDLRFIPGTEPWFSYEALSAFTGQEPKTLQKKLAKLRKHPMFPGFVLCTDMERIAEHVSG